MCTCIYCGSYLPEGYGHVCHDCYKKEISNLGNRDNDYKTRLLKIISADINEYETKITDLKQYYNEILYRKDINAGDITNYMMVNRKMEY